MMRRQIKIQEQALKKYMNAIVSLSISHLHDAANFFALLKRDLESPDLNINDARNFTKGASYHFRSLFEELKANKQAFDKNCLTDSLREGQGLFYKKDVIDLSDLLELELFQLSGMKRLKVSNDTRNGQALILGNFNLLSKVILNLLENALKYTEGDVHLQLSDKGTYWGIKIISFGLALPENILEEPQELLGHGLSSTLDIVDFHKGQIQIHSLNQEGTAISLLLEKVLSF
jgi:signal transduction histidine kinase